MKKIITKISLKPLLTLFTKKKTVRRQSDIVVPKPMPEAEKKPAGRRPHSSYHQMSNVQLLCTAQALQHKIENSPSFSAPQQSLDELNMLITDFQFAMLESKQSKTRITLDHLNNARQAVKDCLMLLKIKYKESV